MGMAGKGDIGKSRWGMGPIGGQGRSPLCHEPVILNIGVELIGQVDTRAAVNLQRLHLTRLLLHKTLLSLCHPSAQWPQHFTNNQHRDIRCEWPEC